MKRQSSNVDPISRTAPTRNGTGVDVARVDRALSSYSAEDWRRDNDAAIAAYNRFVDKHGIWNQGSRPW